MPTGSLRPDGPIRGLLFNRTFKTTLSNAVSEFGRGGLYGRYAAEVSEHLRELDERAAEGEEHDVVVMWDYENMGLWRMYKVPDTEVVNRALRWIAGATELPVTRVEAVQITRHLTTPDEVLRNGYVNHYNTFRQIGGVVHRTWPKMDDAADKVLIERMRMLLDEMHATGRKRTLVLMSSDKGFRPMLEAAQSEGVTAIQIVNGKGEAAKDMPQLGQESRYYPAGCDFSVPIQTPRWNVLAFDLNQKRSPLRAYEEWKPDQGPPLWNNKGVVELEPVGPDEELDRRVFHEWHEEVLGDPDGGRKQSAKYDGTFVREGIRLNATLGDALESARLRNGTVGTRRGRLKPEVMEALDRDLASLASGRGKDFAAVFWNLEEFHLAPRGPTQDEMLARVVRWFENFLMMPVRRMQVGRFVEPWDAPGSSPTDWLGFARDLGMVVDRVWPPKPEAVAQGFTRTLGVMGKAARAASEGASVNVSGLPRLTCILSNQLIFDHDVRLAQREGISTVVINQPLPGKAFTEVRGIYYPANSNATIRIDALDWDTLTAELSEATMDPFLSGAHTPDAPLAVYKRRLAPRNLAWGDPGSLQLDPERLLPAYQAGRRPRLPARKPMLLGPSDVNVPQVAE